jgi:hypothetical protein
MTKDTEALLNMSLDEIIASGRGQNRPKNASGKPAKNSVCVHAVGVSTQLLRVREARLLSAWL